MASRFILTVLVCSIFVPAQEVRVIRSGNGTVSGTDSAVTFLAGPAAAGFPAPFTSTDFLNAQTGMPAFIPAPAGGWATLGSDPLAQWVGTSATAASAGTGLFAIPFNVTTTNIASARLDLAVAVDDFLGDSVNPGVFLNNVQVNGVPNTPSYFFETLVTGLDITSLISQGQNVLYLYAMNTAGAGGVNFAATISIYESAQLFEALPLRSGQTGLVEIVSLGAGSQGFGFGILPSSTPPLPAGQGIPLNGTEFLLDISDPLMNFALGGGTASFIFPNLFGNLSTFNDRGAVIVYVPNDPGLIGLNIYWQGALLTPASSTPWQASNVLTTPIVP